MLMRRTILRRHIQNIHKKNTLDMSTPARQSMVNSCMQAWGRKMAASDVATPTSELSAADFITPVRPKLQVRKIAEVKPHKTLGQPPSPSAANSLLRRGRRGRRR